MREPAPSRWIRRGILVAVVVLSFSPRAFAQSERFPARISVSELEMYRDWMNLSRAQWHATAIAYLDYIREYETLRPEIEKQSEVYANVGADTNEGVLKRMREMRREDDAIKRKIIDADERFFIEIHVILADEQHVGWQRMRDHHARQDNAWVRAYLHRFKRPLIDLADLARRTLRDGDDADAIAPILIDYERKLTTAVSRFSREAAELWPKLLEERVRRGVVGYLEVLDDAAWQKFEADARKGADTAARRLLELNDETSDLIEAALAPDARDAWREAYLALNWPDAASMWGRRMELKRAADRLQLDEAQRDLAHQHFAAFDRGIEELIAAAVAEAEDFRAPRDLTQERIDAHNAFNRQVRLDLRATTDQFKTSLAAALGDDDIAKRLERASADAQKDLDEALSLNVTPRGVTIGTLALNEQEFAQLCDALHMDGEKKDAAQRFFAEYRHGVSEASNKLVAPSSKYVADQAVLDAVKELDGKFFEKMTALLADPALMRLAKALELMRFRTILHSQAWVPQGAARIDLAALVLETDAKLFQATGMIDVFESYHTEALGAFEHAFNLSRALHATAAAGISWSEIEGSRVGMVKMNLRYLDRLLALLTPEAGAQLREAIDRACYPQIVHDPLAVHGELRAMLQRADLIEDQRAQIVQLIADYERDYADLTRRMIESALDLTGWNRERDGRLAPIGVGDRARDFERLRSQRDELSALARLRVEALLTLEQLEHKP